MIPYPIMLDMAGMTALVVGGGKVGLRKVESLLDAGAQALVVSIEFERELLDLEKDGKIRIETGPFQEDIFDRNPGIKLVYGATNHRPTNVRVYEEATRRGVPCNIVDTPDLCSFIVPAIVRSGDVVIAISTGGASPALAKRIRKDLQKLIGPEYGKMALVMSRLRARALKLGKGHDENKKLFTAVVESDLMEHLRTGNMEEAKNTLRRFTTDETDLEFALSDLEEMNRQEV